MSWRILQGDCRDLLRGVTVVHAEPYHHVEYLDLPDNSIDAIVTDPPYGISFMGRDWDHDVPGPEYWKEIWRVAKPGAHLVAFGGTRTFHRLYCAIEDAGWIIRDTIGNLATLLWLQGQGFAKGHRVDVAIDKHFGVTGNLGKAVRVTTGVPEEQANLEKPQSAEEYEPITDEAKRWKGWNVQLKPMFEPIVLARKPLEGNVAENVLKHDTGAMNIDGCRIASGKDHQDKCSSVVGLESSRTGSTYGEWKGKRSDSYDSAGRWPPNMTLTHHPDCKPIGMKKDEYKINRFVDGAKPFGGGAGHEYGTKHCKNIAVEVYECHPECPVRLLDEQSGETGHTGAPYQKGRKQRSAFFGSGGVEQHHINRDDTGGASRFFYTAKASRAEKEGGLDGETETVDDGRQKPIDNPYQRGKTERRNLHPTVKPLSLCRWLVRLVTPHSGTVLDPFCGSGSILAAARIEGFNSIGIDIEAKACEIARKRVAWAGVEAGDATEEDAEEVGMPTQLGLFGRSE